MSTENKPVPEKTRTLFHDLMNELATIKLAMHLAKKKNQTEELEKFFVKSEEAVSRAEKLIEAYKSSYK